MTKKIKNSVYGETKDSEPTWCLVHHPHTSGVPAIPATSRKDIITYRRTERTPTEATRQATHRFIAEAVRPDWWKTTSHDRHETPGVVRVGGKKITP